MAESAEPMIKLEPGGKAPILSYNVPEPTSYSGRNFIELELPDEYFNEKAKEHPPDESGSGGGGGGGPRPPRPPIGVVDAASAREVVAVAMRTGLSDARIFPNAGSIA